MATAEWEQPLGALGFRLEGGAMQAFFDAALVPHDAHCEGDLAQADRLLTGELREDFYVACILGDPEVVGRRILGKGGPRGWEPLVYLAFSRYLRDRPAGHEECARLLLQAGADANGGFHGPDGMWESVLYGVAGIARHPGLTRLLLEHGADPNDDETPYHVPENPQLDCLKLLLGSGRLTAVSLHTLLLRMADHHELEGMRLVLEHGADPNHVGRWGRSALQQAVLRDNRLELVELLLAHGGDPGTVGELAAQRGRGDLLERFGLPSDDGLARCARGLAGELSARDPAWLLAFAGNGNAAGVARLLDAGLDVNAPAPAGDPYFGLAPGSTALHAAAWRGRPEVLRLLLERGADPRLTDSRGRTARDLAETPPQYWERPEECLRLLT